MIQRGVAPRYKVELRLDGTYIGDIRQIAQDLVWKRSRVQFGIDSISFTLNDEIADIWLKKRGSSLYDILRPLALDCRVIRNGVPVCGGYLATIPSYQPNQTSANLAFQFDGYQNLLGGVYMRPQATLHGKMGELVSSWIQEAETRSHDAGKAFGFVEGTVDDMATVDYTFENYKTIKDAISDRCDNTTGAGKFDVFWHVDRTYDIIKDANFGDKIEDYKIFYPTRQNGVSAISISAPEMSDFASTVIGIGAGDVSNDPSKSTAIISERTNSDFVEDYGYYETLIQESSISTQSVLINKVKNTLDNVSKFVWQPEITLSGVQVAPVPDGEQKIWIGDRVRIINDLDPTGLSSGWIRVNEMEVTVSDKNSETIKPTVDSLGDDETSTGSGGRMNFYKGLRKMQNELLNLKTAH